MEKPKLADTIITNSGGTNIHVHNSKESPERNVYSLAVNPNQAAVVRAKHRNRRTTRETALRPSQRDSSVFNVPSAVTSSARRAELHLDAHLWPLRSGISLS